MYFWVTSIKCPKLISFYINYMANRFIPVVHASRVYFWAYSKIKTLMTQRRIREFSTVSIDYQSMTDWSSTFTVLNSRNVTKNQIWSLCTSSRVFLRKYILVEFLVYLQAHIRDSRGYFSRVLCIFFQSYILASRVYFSRVSCLIFDPTYSLCEYILVKSN